MKFDVIHRGFVSVLASAASWTLTLIMSIGWNIEIAMHPESPPMIKLAVVGEKSFFFGS